MRRVLIVNADDYGLCEGVDRGIREAAVQGAVTSVSVLVERLTAESLRALRDEAPHVGVGLHVDLTSDLSRFEGREVEARVAAQFARFCDVVGAPPTHLDTHKHAHRDRPGVLECLAGYGLPVRANGAAVRRTLRRLRVPCTDGFAGDVARTPWWTARRARESLRRLPPGVTEWMCHPGHPDGVPTALWYRAQRFTELRTFTSPGLRARIAAAGVVLSTFEVLARTEKRPCA